MKTSMDIEREYLGSCDLDGNTPLHMAAANGYENDVIKLLKSKAEVDASNIFGWTPLMQAARNRHCNIVSILLQYDADLEKRNKFGLTPLLLASAGGHLQTVHFLLEKGAVFEPNEATYEVSPMMIAALYGNDDVLRLFLDRGFSANLLSPKMHISPLMCAVAGESMSAVEMLIKRGARLKVCSSGGYSAVDVAVACNNTEIVDYLEARTAKRKGKEDGPLDIMEAAKQGDLTSLHKILAKNPSEAKRATWLGVTPLIMAAVMNHVDVAQLLLINGADIDAQDSANGWTPLMQAVYHRHKEMVSFLLRHNASVNIETLQGYTAFDLANEVLDVDILRMFTRSDQVDSSSALKEDNAEVKKRSVSTVTLQSVKAFLKKFMGNPATNQLESIPRKTSSAGLDSPAPTINLAFNPLFPESAQAVNDSDCDIFSKLTKSQNDFMKSMTPPAIETSSRNMPAGWMQKQSAQFFSNDILIKKYNEQCQTAAASSSAGRRMATPQQDAGGATSSAETKKGCHQRRSNDARAGDSRPGSHSEMGRITSLLQKFDLNSCASLFREEEIDREVFLCLRPEDLQVLGISDPHKVKILRAIAEVKAQQKK